MTQDQAAGETAVTARLIRDLGPFTADMLRATFSEWRIVQAAGRWWAVRSGTWMFDGPQSLIRPVACAGTLEWLADQLACQAWLESLGAAELEAVWHGTLTGARP